VEKTESRNDSEENRIKKDSFLYRGMQLPPPPKVRLEPKHLDIELKKILTKKKFNKNKKNEMKEILTCTKAWRCSHGENDKLLLLQDVFSASAILY